MYLQSRTKRSLSKIPHDSKKYETGFIIPFSIGNAGRSPISLPKNNLEDGAIQIVPPVNFNRQLYREVYILKSFLTAVSSVNQGQRYSIPL